VEAHRLMADFTSDFTSDFDIAVANVAYKKVGTHHWEDAPHRPHRRPTT
jgi:hypothetical protein